MSRLRELIEEAQRISGFVYYSTDSTGEGKGYQLLGQKGFKMTDRYEIENCCCWGPGGLEEAVAREERGFNEAIIHGRTKANKQVGEKRVKWYSSKKEPVFDYVSAQTEDVLKNGNQEPASSLTYYVTRVEPDAAGREGTYIKQTLVAPTSLIESLTKELKQEPSNASLIFEGVFPELEGRFHSKLNGKILIARDGEVTHENTDKFVYNYDMQR